MASTNRRDYEFCSVSLYPRLSGERIISRTQPLHDFHPRTRQLSNVTAQRILTAARSGNA